MKETPFTQQIIDATKVLFATLRPWDNTPQITVYKKQNEYGADVYSIKADHDYLGELIPAKGNKWALRSELYGTTTHRLCDTINDAIEFCIKYHFGMRI